MNKEILEDIHSTVDDRAIALAKVLDKWPDENCEFIDDILSRLRLIPVVKSISFCTPSSEDSLRHRYMTGMPKGPFIIINDFVGEEDWIRARTKLNLTI